MNGLGQWRERARVAAAVGATLAAALLWRHDAPAILVEALALVAGLAWLYSDE